MNHTLPTMGSRSIPDGLRRLRTLAVVVAAMALPAAASAVEPILVDATPGASAPAGAFRDGNGDLWLSDHAGLCRLAGPGQGMVPSDYCDPTALAPVHLGPVAPGQAAYDEARDLVYVGDGASNSGGVWRFELAGNPAVVTSATLIVDYSNPLIGDRVFGMSYRNNRLDFATKNSPNIQRIIDPHLCAPVGSPGACNPEIRGSAVEAAASSLAHDNAGNLYITDLPGVTRMIGTGAAQSVPGLNLGAYSALSYDRDNGILYAGTTNPEGVDWIDALDVSTGETATYTVGFDGVTAVGVNPASGDLDVLDDPGVKQVGEDLGGTARRFRVPYTMFAPAPTITAAPGPVSNGQTVTFAYQYPSNTNFHCVLDQGAPQPCGAGTATSLITYNGVGHGAHSFQVIADLTPGNGTLTSDPRTIRRFTIDTRAPVVQIDNVAISGSDAEVRFSADDLNVDFTCRIDTAGPGPCDSPTRYTALANGEHTVTVFATDFIGNVGPSVSTTFRIGPPPPPAWKPGKVISTLRGTTFRVSFTAPPGARFARFTLSKKGVYPVRTKVVPVLGGRRNVITISLPRTAVQRLQGRATVVVKAAAGTTRTSLSTASGAGRLNITLPLVKAR